MAAIKVKLVKSWSGAVPRHVATVHGLGLYRLNAERVLDDTPAIRGMVQSVSHLVSMTVATDQPKHRARRKAKGQQGSSAGK